MTVDSESQITKVKSVKGEIIIINYKVIFQIFTREFLHIEKSSLGKCWVYESDSQIAHARVQVIVCDDWSLRH